MSCITCIIQYSRLKLDTPTESDWRFSCFLKDLNYWKEKHNRRVFFLSRRRGVSKKGEKRKKRQDGRKKQNRKAQIHWEAPVSSLGGLRRRVNPRAAPWGAAPRLFQAGWAAMRENTVARRERTFVRKLLTRSTRYTYFCTVQTSKCQQKYAQRFCYFKNVV